MLSYKSGPIPGSTLTDKINALREIVVDPMFLDILVEPTEFIMQVVPLVRQALSEYPPDANLQFGPTCDIRVFLIRLLSRLPYTKVVGKVDPSFFRELLHLVYSLIATENIFNRYLSLKILYPLLGTVNSIDLLSHIRILSTFFTTELVLTTSQDISKCELGFFAASEVLHYLNKFHAQYKPDSSTYDHLLLAICHALRSFYATNGLERAEGNKKVFCEYARFSNSLLEFVSTLRIHSQHAVLGFLPELCYTLSILCPSDCTFLRIETARCIGETISTYPGLFTSVECYFVNGPFTASGFSQGCHLQTELIQAMLKIITTYTGKCTEGTQALFSSSPLNQEQETKTKQGKSFKSKMTQLISPISSVITKNILYEFQSRINSFIPDLTVNLKQPGVSNLIESILVGLECCMTLSTTILSDAVEMRLFVSKGIRILYKTQQILSVVSEYPSSETLKTAFITSFTILIKSVNTLRVTYNTNNVFDLEEVEILSELLLFLIINKLPSGSKNAVLNIQDDILINLILDVSCSDTILHQVSEKLLINFYTFYANWNVILDHVPSNIILIRKAIKILHSDLVHGVVRDKELTRILFSVSMHLFDLDKKYYKGELLEYFTAIYITLLTGSNSLLHVTLINNLFSFVKSRSIITDITSKTPKNMQSYNALFFVYTYFEFTVGELTFLFTETNNPLFLTTLFNIPISLNLLITKHKIFLEPLRMAMMADVSVREAGLRYIEYIIEFDDGSDEMLRVLDDLGGVLGREARESNVFARMGAKHRVLVSKRRREEAREVVSVVGSVEGGCINLRCSLVTLLGAYCGFEISIKRGIRVLKAVERGDVAGRDVIGFLGKGVDASILLSMMLRGEMGILEEAVDRMGGFFPLSPVLLDALTYGFIYAFDSARKILLVLSNKITGSGYEQGVVELIMRLTDLVYADDLLISNRSLLAVHHLITASPLYDDRFCPFYFYALKHKLNQPGLCKEYSWRIHAWGAETTVALVTRFPQVSRLFESVFSHNRSDSAPLRLFYAEIESRCSLHPTRTSLPPSGDAAITDHHLILLRLITLPSATSYTNLPQLIEDLLRKMERKNFPGILAFINLIESTIKKRQFYSCIKEDTNEIKKIPFNASGILETLYTRLVNAAKKRLPSVAILSGFSSQRAKRRFVESVNKNGHLQSSNPGSFRVFKCLFHGCAMSQSVLNNFAEIFSSQNHEYREAIYEAVLFSSYEGNYLAILSFLFDKLSESMCDVSHVYRILYSRILILIKNADILMEIASFFGKNLHKQSIFRFILEMGDSRINGALSMIYRDLRSCQADIVSYLRLGVYLKVDLSSDIDALTGDLINISKSYYNSQVFIGLVCGVLGFLGDEGVEEILRSGVLVRDHRAVLSRMRHVRSDRLRERMLRMLLERQVSLEEEVSQVLLSAESDQRILEGSMWISRQIPHQEHGVFMHGVGDPARIKSAGNLIARTVSAPRRICPQHRPPLSALLPHFSSSPLLLIVLSIRLGVFQEELLQFCRDNLEDPSLRFAALFYLCKFDPKPDYFSLVLKLNYQEREYAVDCIKLLLDRECASDKKLPEYFATVLKSVIRSEMRFRTTWTVVLPLIREREWILGNREILVEIVALIYRVHLAGESVAEYLDMLRRWCRAPIIDELEKREEKEPEKTVHQENLLQLLERNKGDISTPVGLFHTFQRYSNPLLHSSFRRRYLEACVSATPPVLREAFLALFFRDSADPLRFLLSSDLAGVSDAAAEALMRAAVARTLRVEEGGSELRRGVEILVGVMEIPELMDVLVGERDLGDLAQLVDSSSLSAKYKIFLNSSIFKKIFETGKFCENFNFLVDFFPVFGDFVSFCGIAKAYSGTREVKVVATKFLRNQHSQVLDLALGVFRGVNQRVISYCPEDLKVLERLVTRIYREHGVGDHRINCIKYEWNTRISRLSAPYSSEFLDQMMLEMVERIASSKKLPERKFLDPILSLLSLEFPETSESAARQGVYAAVCSEILEAASMRSLSPRLDSVYGRIRLWSTRYPTLTNSDFVWRIFMRWRMYLYNEYGVSHRTKGETGGKNPRADQSRRRMGNDAATLSLLYASQCLRNKMYQQSSLVLSEMNLVPDSPFYFKKSLVDIEALYAASEYSTALSLIHSMSVGKLGPEERSLLYHWAGECIKRLEGVSEEADLEIGREFGEPAEERSVEEFMRMNKYEVLSRRMAEIIENKKGDLIALKAAVRREDEEAGKILHKKYLENLIKLINELSVEESRVYVMELIRNGRDLGRVSPEKLHYFREEIGEVDPAEQQVLAVLRTLLQGRAGRNSWREVAGSENLVDGYDQLMDLAGTVTRRRVIHVFDQRPVLPGEFTLLRNSYGDLKRLCFVEGFRNRREEIWRVLRLRTEDGCLFGVRSGGSPGLVRCLELLVGEPVGIRSAGGLSFVEAGTPSLEEMVGWRRRERVLELQGLMESSRFQGSEFIFGRVSSAIGVTRYFDLLLKNANILKLYFLEKFSQVFSLYNFKYTFVGRYSKIVSYMYFIGAAQNGYDRVFLEDGRIWLDGVAAGKNVYLRPNVSEVFGMDGKNGELVRSFYEAAEGLAENKKILEFYLGPQGRDTALARARLAGGSEKGVDPGKTAERVINEMVDPRNGLEMPVVEEGWL